MQFEIAETADFKGFGIARKACALKGERWVLSTTLNAGRLTLVDDVSVGSDHPLDF